MTPAMVREAAHRIKPLTKRTPVLTSRGADSLAGASVFFKCENFQRGGSFKIRGASNLILSLDRSQLERGVVAFSSGNHAQATAIAARHVGTQATIVMPLDAPRSKVAATRDFGATIVTYDRLREDREQIAAGILAATGATLVPPYDHELIIAGQGTCALELLEETGPLDALVVCLGGGGLCSGSAVIAHDLYPSLPIFGVEPERANDWHLSMQAGHRVEIGPPDTIADGLRSPIPGRLTFPILQHQLEKVVLVTEEEIRRAMSFLLGRMKILVEPSGAVAAAALLSGKIPRTFARIGVILSGGNVDLKLLADGMLIS